MYWVTLFAVIYLIVEMFMGVALVTTDLQREPKHWHDVAFCLIFLRMVCVIVVGYAALFN